MNIRKIASPSARNTDLFSHLKIVLKHNNRSASFSCLNRAHQPCGTGTNDHHITRDVIYISFSLHFSLSKIHVCLCRILCKHSHSFYFTHIDHNSYICSSIREFFVAKKHASYFHPYQHIILNYLHFWSLISKSNTTI